MTRPANLRRLAVELIIFLLLTTAVFYFAAGQESIADALIMGTIATVVYGGITCALRQPTNRDGDNRQEFE